MAVEELQSKQEQLRAEMYSNAEKLGLSKANLKPIPDGVLDAEKYLTSSRKIMWVLKEPYDDIDEEGNPQGGDWYLEEGFLDENGNIKESAKKIRTWQLMAYTTYGILNKIHYDDEGWVQEDDQIMESLLGTAYVNISKMPNLTSSGQTNLCECYENWKTILFKQIDLYNPDVIIFGGTIAPFWHDLESNGIVYDHDNSAIRVYDYKGTKIIDAYHPNQRKIKWELYADSIIDECI